MERELKLEVLTRDEHHVKFCISEQTHRGIGFAIDRSGMEGFNFRASNGITLASVSFPEHNGATLNVRGDNKFRDHEELVCTTAKWKKILQAVREYNNGVHYCALCGRRARKPKMVNGVEFCSVCARRKKFTCAFCEKPALWSERAKTESGLVCSRCADLYFITCSECGRVVERRTSDGDSHSHYCADCWERLELAYCNYCGRVLAPEDQEEVSGNYYCAVCAEERRIALVVREWDYRPEFKFHGVGKLFLGAELEVDCGNREVLTELACYAESEVFFKGDGSLGEEGIEAVTHPCTLKYHLEKFPWDELVSDFLSHGFLSHDAGTCGLHVHVNNAYFGKTETSVELAQLKILTLFNRFWSEFVKLSRRKSFRYCHKNEEAYTIEDVKHIKGGDRYYAINLQNTGTTEFRLWRGSLLLQTIFATLEMTDALCRYVKSHSVQQVIKITWPELKNELINKTSFLKNYMEERSV